MMGKSWICDPCDKARDVEQIVDFCEVCIGESMSSEPSKNCTRREGTGRKDSLGDFSAWAIMPQKDDPFLSKQRIHKHNDRMSINSRCGQMGMKCKRLRRSRMGPRKGLNELDEREISYGFWRERGRNFDGNWYLVVDDFRFKLMCVPGRVMPRCRSVDIGVWLRRRVWRADRVGRRVIRHPLLYHSLEFLNK